MRPCQSERAGNRLWGYTKGASPVCRCVLARGGPRRRTHTYIFVATLCTYIQLVYSTAALECVPLTLLASLWTRTYVSVASAQVSYGGTHTHTLAQRWTPKVTYFIVLHTFMRRCRRVALMLPNFWLQRHVARMYIWICMYKEWQARCCFCGKFMRQQWNVVQGVNFSKRHNNNNNKWLK